VRGLSGKVALVTGATKAMGGAVAARLASEGASVVLTGRSVELGEEAATRIRENGHRAAFVATDVSREEDVQQAVTTAVATFGRLDIVVNNAAALDGTTGEQAVVEEPTEVFDRILKVGLYGPFWFAKYAVPEMIKNATGGCFVNISSYASAKGVPGLPGYATSKGGLEAFTRQIAAEYATQGIRANAVLLGSILVPRTKVLHDDPERGERSRQGRLIQRVGTPDDVASMVAFLASDEAGFVTGAVIPLDGGLSIKAPGSGVVHQAHDGPT
jgi:NAD(P)-dependent dehydrogenase (short-subunit alcohol dehydrogenase family)